MAKPQEMREFIMADLDPTCMTVTIIRFLYQYTFLLLWCAGLAACRCLLKCSTIDCGLAFALLYIDAVVQFHACPSFRNREGPFHHAILPFCYCGVGYRITEWQNIKTAEWNGPYFHLWYLKDYVLSVIGKYHM